MFDGRARFIAILEILLCSGVPTQFAIIGLLNAAGWTSADTAGHPLLPFVLAQLTADTVLVVVLMVVFLRVHGERPAAIWAGRRPVPRELAIGLVTVPAILVTVGLMLNTLRLLLPQLHNVATNPLEQMATAPGQAPAFAVLAIVAGGMKEELQRAFMLHRFEQHLGGATVGVVVISLAFGLGHAIQGWDAVITTGALGAFWAWLYLRRRSSIAPVVSHAGFNALEILRVAVVGQ